MIRVGINIELMVLSGLLLVPKLLHVSKVFGGDIVDRKSKIEKLEVDNLDLQSDNAMNMQKILVIQIVKKDRDKLYKKWPIIQNQLLHTIWKHLNQKY